MRRFMFKVSIDASGQVTLPVSLRRRHQIDGKGELLPEKVEDGLILHPILPDVHKIYLEITTRCTLNCLTCIHKIWSEPIFEMNGDASCVDCKLSNTCDLTAVNKACRGLDPSCADCL